MCIEKVKLTLNVPKDKKEKLQEIANKRGITMTAMVILAMNDIIDEEENRKAVRQG